MRLQPVEHRFGVLGKGAFQFPKFAIVRPLQQVISPPALLVVKQGQHMLEQRRGFRRSRGGVTQRLIQTLTGCAAIPGKSAAEEIVAMLQKIRTVAVTSDVDVIGDVTQGIG